MGEAHLFTITDYVVFGITIAISLGIGVYSALSGGKQKTTREFLVGDRKLRVFPVALSLIVSFESSILMLGFPAEMYTYGIQYAWTEVSSCFAMVIIAFLIIPTFYNMKVISAYEYLQKRFKSRHVRMVGAALGAMTNLWYMGIVLYGPATALQAVTGFKMWYSITVISAVAMLYTSIGGIKAVIWADVFQSGIMVGGMVAVIVKGTMAVGGMSNLYDVNRRGHRMDFFNFDFDPTVRVTFWSITIGYMFRMIGVGTSQSTIQRISSTPTLTHAKLVTILSGPGFLVFGTLAAIEGFVAYAYFEMKKCDPLEYGLINNPNQILPYFVMELFHDLPGLPGLFLASLFSGSLSTLSSGYASLSAILWTDFIQPFVTNISDFEATLIAKTLVVISGGFSIGIAVLVMQVGGPMTQIAATILTSFAGPLSGVFLLGGLVSEANAKGALAAFLVSCTFSLWKGFGSSFSTEVVKTPYLPSVSIANCSVMDNTTPALMAVNRSTTNIRASSDSSMSPLTIFYSISYMWIASISIFLALVVGTVVSYATGGRDESEIKPEELMPVCDRLFCCLPERFRRLCRIKSAPKPELLQESYIMPEYSPERPTNHKMNAVVPS